MIKNLDERIYGIAALLYDINKRQKDIIENLALSELEEKRDEYRRELGSEIGKLEHKRHSTPELFNMYDVGKLDELVTKYRDAYTTVFPSSYTEELAILEKTAIFLNKAGEESTRLFEYYVRTNGEYCSIIEIKNF